jgi:hypothetical protein
MIRAASVRSTDADAVTEGRAADIIRLNEPEPRITQREPKSAMSASHA